MIAAIVLCMSLSNEMLAWPRRPHDQVNELDVFIELGKDSL
jgi:hypothetical protein